MPAVPWPTVPTTTAPAEQGDGSVAAGGRRPRWSIDRRDRWWLLGVVGVGVVLRLAWAVYAARPPMGLHDPGLYTVLAEQVASGRGYTYPIPGGDQPTAYYPVGYPAVLAVVFWLADHTPLPDGRVGLVVALNLVAAAISLVLVYEIGRRLADRRVGLVAAGLLAVFPNLIFHTSVALTETVFNTIALAAVLVLVATRWQCRSTATLAAFGALVGLSALVRPPSLLFLPILAVVGWWGAGWGWREAGRSLLVAGIAATAVIAPWTVRNAFTMTSPVIISTNMGDNLCIGNNPDANGAFQMPPSCLDGYDHLDRPEYELQRDADARRKGIEHIIDEPADQLRLVPLRLWHTFRNDTDGLEAAESYGADRFIPATTRSVLELAANVTFFATLAAALAATPLLLRGRRPDRLLVALVAVSLVVPPLVFFGDVRFHVPMVPYLTLAAALLAVSLRDRAQGPARR
jgi:4-amino-4-deoxy-L-arabinose transferase-like glycosyltransferase